MIHIKNQVFSRFRMLSSTVNSVSGSSNLSFIYMTPNANIPGNLETPADNIRAADRAGRSVPPISTS